MQVQAQIQNSLAQLQQTFARQLDDTTATFAAENVRLLDEIRSAILYSQRECSKARESQRRALETRIIAVEEVKITKLFCGFAVVCKKQYRT